MRRYVEESEHSMKTFSIKNDGNGNEIVTMDVSSPDPSDSGLFTSDYTIGFIGSPDPAWRREFELAVSRRYDGSKNLRFWSDSASCLAWSQDRTETARAVVLRLDADTPATALIEYGQLMYSGRVFVSLGEGFKYTDVVLDYADCSGLQVYSNIDDCVDALVSRIPSMEGRK